MKNIDIQVLTPDRLEEAINLVLAADLDTREEIEHHLQDTKAHFIALSDNKITGVIGWYQDTVDYATDAMGDLFPGMDAYWVGFFAVDKDYRGKGVGFALINKLKQAIKDFKAKELWVSSVVEAKKYYQRQGFKVVTQGDISGRLHYFMVCKLAN